jgi:hypothetical protein
MMKVLAVMSSGTTGSQHQRDPVSSGMFCITTAQHPAAEAGVTWTSGSIIISSELLTR